MNATTATTATTTPDDYVSVKEAANILHLHPSSVWRLIDAGVLPAVRFGRRKLMLRRQDLAMAATPASAVQKPATLTPEERRRALEALDRLAAIREALFEANEHKLFPPSWQLLDEIRGLADEPDYDGQILDMP